MKYVIVQVSKYYICITPAESGKAFVNSGKDRDAKRPDYEVTFKEPLVVFLPESLRGQAWNFPRDLAEVVRMSMRNAKIDIKDVILCAECDQLISQEYQHTPAKDKYLRIFAENEAKGLISDDISNYSLINCEYGAGAGQEEESSQLGANVYIMPKSFVEELKTAFREQSLTLYKLIPPTVSMVKIAKTGINSYDKSVALISIDFCSARLLVMQKGVPVYVHSFQLPLGDITNIFAADQNCTLEEAFEVIRKYGVGISEKCNSRQAGREMRQTFENFSNDVVRSLRMVLLSLRIELDQIYISDFGAYIPGMLKHVRTISVQADEINDISSAFTALTNVPIITKETDEAGYKTACFYTYTYIVNSGAQNENNLAAITGSKSVDLGVAATGLANIGAMVFAVVAVGVMVFIGLKSYRLELRAQQDQAKLADPHYDEIKGLLKEQSDYQNKMSNVDEEMELLDQEKPLSDITDVMTNVFTQFTDDPNVYVCHNYDIDIGAEEMTVDFKFFITTREDYSKLRSKIDAEGDFYVQEKGALNESTYTERKRVVPEKKDDKDKDKDKDKDSDTDGEKDDDEKEEDDRPRIEETDIPCFEGDCTLTVLSYEGTDTSEGDGGDGEFDGHHTDISNGDNLDAMTSSYLNS